MIKHLVFAFSLLITFVAFGWTIQRLYSFFRLTRPAFPVRDLFKRIGLTLKVAFGQTKILRRPVVGLMHALVWWGFLVILFGSIEMVIDGLSGTERILSFFGFFYDILMASGDVFALIILVMILGFLFRRIFLKVKRFTGIEMKHKSHLDANVALTMILLLMVSLLAMNTFYIVGKNLSGEEVAGLFPVSNQIAGMISGMQPGTAYAWHEAGWWTHILLIFIFANYLPYSKHFHVFMSVPNVFLSNLSPLGKLKTMDNITREVKLMLNPDTAFSSGQGDDEPVERFGILDVEDINWKNYLDSLACTECGRCTSVCPANLTGKKLSPRKIVMDVRARMKEKGPGLVKSGKDFNDGKSLIGNYITEEELWACTTCNACAQECPVNINQPSLIIDMRRYLVMEKSAAPSELNQVFSNIENNGAPWQYSQQDRLRWADDLYINQPAV